MDITKYSDNIKVKAAKSYSMEINSERCTCLFKRFISLYMKANFQVH